LNQPKINDIVFKKVGQKRSISGDFIKNENRRTSVTDAKMHIFEKFKKGALATSHELPNPKKLRIWTNQKKMPPLLRK
jgi:hypothetical protein